MGESPSITTVVVGDRLPWPDEPWAAECNGPFDPGAIFHFGTRQDCAIRKISSLGVTVRSDLTPALGERVLVELTTGQRPSGKVAWTSRDELGIRFDDCVDMIALLNRKLVSQLPERRTMPRIELRCPVHIKAGDAFRIATLRNISAKGLQIEGDDLPATGGHVIPFVDGLTIPSGKVVWRRDKLAGVEVIEEMSWTTIIPWVRNLIRAS